nr:putative amino-acid permease c15c4.04c [Quercus suber]
MADQITSRASRRRKSSVTIVEMQNPHGTTRVVNVEDMTDADRALAAEFGYKPVFKREFGYLSTFSFAVSISGLFSTVATTFSYPLYAGGSASAVWCWLISGAGCMCIALSVSELVSAYPTCGGLYYTVSRLAPRKWVPSISWVTGWLNLLGQVAGVASSEWGAASLLLAAVSMGSNFTYLPTTGQTVGVMAGLTVLTGLVNSLSTYWMEKMTKSYVIFHILVLVSCSVALLALAQPSNGTAKHDATYVFTNVNNQSGWTPIGWSFMFGFLSVSWTMTDYDATAHITEEIRDPEIKAPWAISMAMLFTYLAGFLFNIVLCFVMGDISLDNPASILNSPVEQPVAQIFYNVLGKAGGIVFTICAFIIIKFVTFTAMQALARTVFAFSRDRLVPASSLWTKILPLTGTPILAVWISVFWCIAINLIGLGSYTAIAGVFNVCAIALDWSYCIPIFCKLIFGNFQPGPWHLGKFSKAVNVWACLWTLFVSIIFVMPTALPVSADTMNYAIVYLGAILFFSMLYWVVFGHKHYTGPLIEAEMHEDDSQADRSSDDYTEKKTAQDGEILG